MAPKSAKDHWAFLEEIEAPMWTDLAREADYSDSDDQWFHISHPFHQQSSENLKAAFAHSADESVSLDSGLTGQSSPQIPSSVVSRSRGKQLPGKGFYKGGHELGMNKQHPVKALKGKSSLVNSGLDDERKPKVKLEGYRGTSNSQGSLVSERALTGCIKENGVFPLGNGKHSKNGEANTSTLTSELYQQPQRRINKLYSVGNAGSLLAGVRIGFRKSSVTRQTARVEVNNDTIQTTNHRSSPSKYGVGSSVKPGFYRKSETNCRPSSGKSSWGSSSNFANDVMGGRVRKSSSAKSSVGSSFNPGDDVKDYTVRKSSSAKSSVGSSFNPGDDVKGNTVRRSSSAKSSVGSSFKLDDDFKDNTVCKSSSARSSVGSSSNPCASIESKPNQRCSSARSSVGSSFNPGNDVKGNTVRKSSSAKSSVGSSFKLDDDVKDNTVCKSSSAKSSVGSSSNPCASIESKPNRRSSSVKSSTESSSSSTPSISSSSNPGGDVKCSGFALLRGKEWTSGSRNAASNTMAAIKKCTKF